MAEERTHHRPSWDDYFMAITKLIATRASCDRLYAGAILVKDKRIIGTGYNGSPPGLAHCDDAGHLLEGGHCVRTIHGEHNVILQAARQGSTSTEGSTLYTKYSPCIHCTKYIIGCGIKRIVVGKVYRNAKVVDMFREAGINVEFYKENSEWNKEVIQLFSEEIPERTNEGNVDMETRK